MACGPTKPAATKQRICARQAWFGENEERIFPGQLPAGENGKWLDQLEVCSFLVTDLSAVTPSGPKRSMIWR